MIRSRLQVQTLLAALGLVVSFISPMSASAQVIGNFIDHAKNTAPRTIHTIIELEYFPSVGEQGGGMPAFRLNANFINYDEEPGVRELYYHSTWGNAFGLGLGSENGVILYEEFITAGLSYRPHEKVATALTWEPLGIYGNPNQAIFGSGLTAQIAFPLVLLEWNERAQGALGGFVTQWEPNARIRNVKVRFNLAPNIYLSFTRQGILSTDGPMNSVAFGIGM